MQRVAPGVHPAVRHAGRVDAGGRDQPPSPSGATENTILGPFYVPEAPRYENGANICLDGKGEPTVVRGRVVDTGGNPIGALIDVWQTNEDGFYDVQQKGVQPDWNLRGVFTTDQDGAYWFRSVKPRYYPIPDDGPVGKMLAALGRHPSRPAHIHFIVTAPGYDPIITRISLRQTKYLSEDAVFGVKETLIADLEKSMTRWRGSASASPCRSGRWPGILRWLPRFG